MRFLTGAALVVLLAGCGEPRFNSSLESSIADITARMTPADRDRFMRAAVVVAMNYDDGGADDRLQESLVRDGVTNEEAKKAMASSMAKMRSALHGKTVKEVLAEAERLQANGHLKWRGR